MPQIVMVEATVMHNIGATTSAMDNSRISRGIGGGAENAGRENDGREIDGPMCRA